MAILLTLSFSIYGQSERFTAKDSLRGGYGDGRLSWDLLHYDLHIVPSIENKTLYGSNTIRFQYLRKGPLQLDFQEPMVIDSILMKESKMTYSRDGNIFFINAEGIEPGEIATMKVYFHGIPPKAVNPPWDGGWIFKNDKQGNPWISVACQDIGASCWFPCKETQQDEPDSGAIISIDVPDSLTAVANGRLLQESIIGKNIKRFVWEVKSPINQYCLIPYIGKFSRIRDQYAGLGGPLDLEYWVLSYNKEKAEAHFGEVKKMLQAFEYWFGPYPFYRDGYKLVEAPHLGMEHQSAIAYGNEYMMGYKGKDLSGSGYGLFWDFIIVHESGHEWFGNSITSKDIADIWIHESFTTYSEILFTEFFQGKKAADEYCKGLRNNIDHNSPCKGSYGVYDNPAARTSDMYWKGANMLHTIRQICNDDLKFRMMLLEMNRRFFHRQTDSKEVESMIMEYTGVHPSLFRQYLSSTEIPEFEYRAKKRKLYYRWSRSVLDLHLPLKVNINGKENWLKATSHWQKCRIKGKIPPQGILLTIDQNYYVDLKKGN
jgi:aminopeptidase N